MRRCEDCKLILDSDVRFCPKCGRPVDGDRPAHNAPNLPLGALLTSANLHRVRKEWDAAAADALAALELDPNNADTASLLASIYEQRGDLDEAAIWYRIAVELNPESTADKARLQRVSQALSARSAPATNATQRRRLMWAGVAAGVLFLALALALLLTPRGRQADIRRSTRTQVEQKTPKMDVTHTPTTGAQENAQRPPSGTGDLAGGASSSQGVRTPAEVVIRNAVSQSQDLLAKGAKVDDVIADPREAVVVVTVAMPSATRSSVIEAAIAAARATFGANAQVRFVTVRCVISDPSATQIAFVGDIARETVASLGDSPTQQQLDAVFTNKWWNQLLR